MELAARRFRSPLLALVPLSEGIAKIVPEHASVRFTMAWNLELANGGTPLPPGCDHDSQIECKFSLLKAAHDCKPKSQEFRQISGKMNLTDQERRLRRPRHVMWLLIPLLLLATSGRAAAAPRSLSAYRACFNAPANHAIAARPALRNLSTKYSDQTVCARHRHRRRLSLKAVSARTELILTRSVRRDAPGTIPAIRRPLSRQGRSPPYAHPTQI